MTAVTQYSWMTEEELISLVHCNDKATEMEHELCDRLEHAIDYVQEIDRRQAMEHQAIELALSPVRGRA